MLAFQSFCPMCKKTFLVSPNLGARITNYTTLS
jgi:hypothetical protein